MVSQCQEQSGLHSTRIQVLGYYGKQNLGDDHFQLAFESLFGSKIDFLWTNDKVDPHRPLIVGGGDVIKRSYLDRIPTGMPYYVLGAGLGYESELDLLDYPISGTLKEVYFRNHSDVHEARRRGLNAHLCPDLTFALDRPAPLPRYQRTKKRLAVILANSAVHPGMTLNEMPDVHYLEYMKWELAKALDRLTEWYEIHFLPMSRACYSFDETMHQEVASRMIHGYKAKLHDFNPHSTSFLQTVGDCDLVISMKFHGLIFSTIMGVPFVNIGLTRKTSLFCQENELSSLMVQPYSLTVDRLLDAVKRAERESVPPALKVLTMLNREHWREIARKLASWVPPTS